MVINTTRFPLPPASLLARRRWLKGAGALLGLAALAAPARALAVAPATASVAEPIGTVKLRTGLVVPAGWALCEGQLLPTTQHPALFAVLRAAHGGDGRHTFALPDLRNEMAAMRTLAASRPAEAVPMGQLCVIKVAHAPALAPAGVELRLHHQRRAQPMRS